MIDAHQHYWDPARGDLGWLQPGSPLDRAFEPEDLEPVLHWEGVAGTLLVQAAPTLAGTDWLLQLAERTATVLGVVGWIDLDGAEVGERLAERMPRGLVGIRPMLQDIADPDWILGAARVPALRAAVRAGIVFDALVRPSGLAAVAALADRHPDLAIVLDHAGKPPVATARMAEWWQGLVEVAARPNVWCKLSGLVSEAPPGTSSAIIGELVRRLVDLWGPDRLIWGSDWPVLTLLSDFGAWLALTRQALGDLSEEERVAVFGGNAKRVYGL
jgi:L-fuconolactonase